MVADLVMALAGIVCAAVLVVRLELEEWRRRQDPEMRERRLRWERRFEEEER